jgi:hypothetical protein
LVHVLPDGEEVDYATPPADVPTLLVTVITMRATYIEKYTLTHLCVDVETDRARIGRPRWDGWRYDRTDGGSARWVRRRELKQVCC